MFTDHKEIKKSIYLYLYTLTKALSDLISLLFKMHTPTWLSAVTQRQFCKFLLQLWLLLYLWLLLLE